MPLMYLESMGDGAMKGMGEQKAVFRYSMWDSCLRIAGVVLLLPRFGMKGFLFVILLSSLYTCAANTGIIDGICRPAKKPVFAGEEGICSGCGVATLSISYYDLGYTTGEMAVKILKGEADISTMPIEYTDVTKKYNKAVCDDLGLTVPEGYEAIEG